MGGGGGVGEMGRWGGGVRGEGGPEEWILTHFGSTARENRRPNGGLS